MTPPEKRYHLSNDPALEVADAPPSPREEREFKPKGFWYSVGLDWIRWLEGEDYLDNLDWMRPYLYEVELDMTNVLVLNTGPELESFNDQYAGIWDLSPSVVLPNWWDIKEKFSGMEIAPYQWNYRLRPAYLWYYGWDCASGVIWRSSAVRELRLVAESEVDIVDFYKAAEDSRRMA